MYPKMTTFQKIFLSSDGSGNIAATWKGLIIALLGIVFPGEVFQQDIMGIADTLIAGIGLIWMAYGLFRKVVKGRWSAPEGSV